MSERIEYARQHVTIPRPVILTVLAVLSVVLAPLAMVLGVAGILSGINTIRFRNAVTVISTTMPGASTSTTRTLAPTSTSFERATRGAGEVVDGALRVVAGAMLLVASIQLLRSRSGARRSFIQWISLKVPLSLLSAVVMFLSLRETYEMNPEYTWGQSPAWIALSIAGSVLTMDLILPLVAVFVLQLREAKDWFAKQAQVEMTRS